MKKTLCLCLALIFILSLPVTGLAEKAQCFPAWFQVNYTVQEYKVNNDQSFIFKEYITTSQTEIDAEINKLVDAYEKQMAPALHRTTNPRRNSR